MSTDGGYVIAVVAGGAQGIGFGVAQLLAERGWFVSIWDVDGVAAESAAAEVRKAGHTAEGRAVDVTDQAAVDSATAGVSSEHGSVDGLVNCAMVLRRAPLDELTLADWNATLSVGLTGTFLCCQSVARIMRRQGHGSIVNFASLAASHPQTYLGSYSPCKAGVVALSQQMAVEWGPMGIRCNTVSPGFTRTPPTEHLYKDPELAAHRQGLVPVRRFGTPDDMARVAAFLLSDDAAYISGADIAVDGGLSRTLIDQSIGGDSALRALRP
jgi:glucose 1-dehydrogenase